MCRIKKIAKENDVCAKARSVWQDTQQAQVYYNVFIVSVTAFFELFDEMFHEKFFNVLGIVLFWFVFLFSYFCRKKYSKHEPNPRTAMMFSYKRKRLPHSIINH